MSDDEHRYANGCKGVCKIEYRPKTDINEVDDVSKKYSVNKVACSSSKDEAQFEIGIFLEGCEYYSNNDACNQDECVSSSRKKAECDSGVGCGKGYIFEEEFAELVNNNNANGNEV